MLLTATTFTAIATDEESEHDDRHLAQIYLAHLAQPVSISIRMTAVNGLAQTQCVTE